MMAKYQQDRLDEIIDRTRKGGAEDCQVLLAEPVQHFMVQQLLVWKWLSHILKDLK